jgi:cytochrome c oxidase cbb3-type subunit III
MSNDGKEKDPFSGVETTGHEWDGLKELNNPAPRWWLLVFVISCIWAIGYWVAYPALITKRGDTSGLLNWSSGKQLAESRAEIEARRAAQVANFDQASLETIRDTPAMYQFARAGGQSLFKENCAPCHGAGAAGGKGYPNLNDDDWIWGGTLQDVYVTIQSGIRAKDDDTRISQMPSFGADGVLKPEEIDAVAYYVETLSGRKTPASAQVLAVGKQIYADNCASCHAPAGEGLPDVGGPRLNDGIWLYGSTHADILAQVHKPRQGVMPAWSSRLPEASIKQLAIYIDSLGGVRKQAATAPAEAAVAPAPEAPAAAAAPAEAAKTEAAAK